MTIDIGRRVEFANDHIATRLGSTITYYRWYSESYDPETGSVKIYWEQPDISATVMSVSETDIDSLSGNVKIGDSKFSFRVDAFTDHSDDEYLSFTSGSTEFTSGETLTGATSGATGVVVNYHLLDSDGGSWSAGTAAGVVWISDVSGTFESENLDGSIAGNNCATISAASISGGDDDVEPNPNDTIIYDGDTWVLDLGSKNTVWKKDITRKMYQVYARRRE
jgi:hypothetical protein